MRIPDHMLQLMHWEGHDQQALLSAMAIGAELAIEAAYRNSNFMLAMVKENREGGGWDSETLELAAHSLIVANDDPEEEKDTDRGMADAGGSSNVAGMLKDIFPIFREADAQPQNRTDEEIADEDVTDENDLVLKNPQVFDYGHPVYREARRQAFERSGGMCQLCGKAQAQEAHHWAMKYPPVEETTADDITALCGECHDEATRIRRTRMRRLP